MRKNYRKVSSTKKNTGESIRGTTCLNNNTTNDTGTCNNNNSAGHSERNPKKGGRIGNSPSIIDAHDTLLVPKDVADMLRVTEAAVRDQIRKKKIPAHVHCDKYAILRSELMWTIRNTDCTMDISDMYKDLDEEESA